MHKIAVRLWIVPVALFFMACTQENETPVTPVEIGSQVSGTFVDAPVSGLGYSAASGSGRTSSTGKFSCKYGEMVTFSVGDMELGEAPCAEVIFPMQLTNEDSVDATGGAVAMGVLFKALDANSSDSVFTIPAAVQSMSFSSTVNFSSFNSGTGLASFKAMLDEINTDASLSIDSNGIQTGYGTIHGPAAVAELEGNLVNDDYVNLPSNIASYDGKYFLITGTLRQATSSACGAIPTIYLGVGFDSLSAGSGTAYRAALYEATSSGIDTGSEIGKGLLTSQTLSLSAAQTISGVNVTSHAVIKFNSGGTVGLSGSGKVVTSSDSCVYTFSAEAVTPSAPPSGGGAAVLSISDGATYNYGTQGVGSSTDHSFTVTNSGTVSATSMSGGGIAAPFTFKGGSYPGTGGTCAVTLPAAASCTMVVSYEPTSAGVHSDTIDLGYNDGSAAQTASRAIQGTGAAVALLVISDGANYNFGSVNTGNTASHSFTVTNAGGATATSISGSGLASPFSFKGGVYPGTGGTCAVTLPAAATCIIVVEYSPVSTGAHSDTIILNYNDSVTAQTSTRDVSGTGL